VLNVTHIEASLGSVPLRPVRRRDQADHGDRACATVRVPKALVGRVVPRLSGRRPATRPDGIKGSHQLTRPGAARTRFRTRWPEGLADRAHDPPTVSWGDVRPGSRALRAMPCHDPAGSAQHGAAGGVEATPPRCPGVRVMMHVCRHGSGRRARRADPPTHGGRGRCRRLDMGPAARPADPRRSG